MASRKQLYPLSFIVITTLLTTTLVTTTSAAQSGPTLLRGRVLDPAQAPLAGAHITASPARGDARSTDTGVDGSFMLALAAGQYTLTLTRPGFVQTTTDVNLPAAGLTLPDAILSLLPVETAVTVAESAGYLTAAISTGVRTLTPLRDLPQSVTVITAEQVKDQMLLSLGDVARLTPGLTAIQGENNRDQLVIRGNSTSADFFLDGVRDDVQYYRDLYNVDRVEVLKGSNAMQFGRGGGGGVVNRVTKEAGPTPLYEFSVLGGSFSDKRFAADVDQPLTETLALRLNGVFEDSQSFRDFVGLTRHGVTPTLAFTPDSFTRLSLRYENFGDHRTADRGIPSYAGRAAELPPNAYFGNPDQSRVFAGVNIGAIQFDRHFHVFDLQNRTLIADYDRGYRNFVPGAVAANGREDSLSAYDNATHRRNFFNQTDLTRSFFTGRIRHSVAGGSELGRQSTDNLRNTGYFGDPGTALALTTMVPLDNGVVTAPILFRHAPTDAFNHLRTDLAAVYVQDQISLSRFVQLTAGLRWDDFDLHFFDHNTPTRLRRIDHLLSPRLGLVFKPAAPVSLYSSYSVSYLPSAGDQFSSLTATTQAVKPEKFTNIEAGLKWDISRHLAFTSAVYRLDRVNTRAVDPNYATRIVLTGSSRTDGFETGITGSVLRRWKLAAGYGYQNSVVTSATTAARAGARTAQVPHHTFSLWNNVSLTSRLGLGAGLVSRSSMFAAIDDSVVLPGYARFDAAGFYSFSERIRFQVNVENLAGRRYILNADNNNNLSPGSPRAIRAGLILRF